MLVFLLYRRIFFAAALKNGEGDIRHDARKQQAALQPPDLPVQRQHKHQDRDADHQRDFEPHQALRDDQRRDHGPDAQDQQDVVDVAADDVAHHQIALPRQAR